MKARVAVVALVALHETWQAFPVAQATQQRFDVVSIKENKSGAPDGLCVRSPADATSGRTRR